MKKAEYIAELKRRLANFSPSEVEDAVSYCEEYFEEAGDGNDQQVIDDLGTPDTGTVCSAAEGREVHTSGTAASKPSQRK